MADTIERCLTDADRQSSAWSGQRRDETLVDRSSGMSIESSTARGRLLIWAASPVGPVWLQATMQRIGELMQLAPGWDSYGAPSIDKGAVRFALTILPHILGDRTPPPQVVPTTSGGLQFEWHRGGVDLEIEVSGPFRIRAFFEDEQREVSWEKDFTRDLGLLVDAVRRLEQLEENRP